MPTLLDTLFALVVVIGLAARAWTGMRRLRAQPEAGLPAARRRAWARAIASQWGLVAVLVAMWIARGRSWSGLGVVAHAGYGLAGVAIGTAILFAMLAAQRRQLAANGDLRARVRERLANVQALMPASRAEWPGFASLALTAGICEELLFRGFLTWYLAHFLGAFWQVVLLQAATFGLAHAYQGPRGILATGFVGLFMALVVWVTGSIWAAMALHALIDLHAGDLSLRVRETDAAAGAGA